MKKVFFMAAVIAAATVNVLMMSNDKSDLSALQMENIEALASGCENGKYGGGTECGICRFDTKNQDNCNWHGTGSYCPEAVCRNRM